MKTFKVLVQTSTNKIEWVNVFELSTWNRIEELLKKQAKVMKNMPDKDAVLKELKDILRRELMYWFWSKCEWEVVVQGWPNNGTEKKIDVFEQISANYELFEKIVFDNI